jgi:hypothetical protein
MSICELYYIIKKENDNNSYITIDFCMLVDTEEYISKNTFYNNEDLINNLSLLVQNANFSFLDIYNNVIRRSNCILGFYKKNDIIFGLEYTDNINNIIKSLIIDLKNK